MGFETADVCFYGMRMRDRNEERIFCETSLMG